MSGPKERFEGGCLCGAVRFIATGEQKGMYWCHCQSYRKHIGAPVAVFVAYQPKDKFTKGEITKFDSTPERTRRGFYARCGSTLTCESLPVIALTHFHVGAFDQAARGFSRESSSSLRNGCHGCTPVMLRTRYSISNLDRETEASARTQARKSAGE